ncbi:AMP-binding protein [Parasphaerochaeta coccoides]|uniref:Long-chain-fatty-acid--CoA ligase n=1 Tax=Parasphaerochaeta coccoides (strain ATCC BAA-1237 / DSM 17374 / SPN1) TaxID=760011 RepID=F4GHZ5_PARC1|nr:AMP-binding protein [Parasphaerochaeta coccoides]AEC02108.1 Long-chain-fatty-acid--CoA ligase [Parasphaerochaeta coccoides DSM 17374]
MEQINWQVEVASVSHGYDGERLKKKTVPEFTMKALVDTIAKKYKGRLALTTYRQNDGVTYDALRVHVRSVSAQLLAAGIHPGDRIAILSESNTGWMRMYLGITGIRAVAVPILPDFPAKDVEKILVHCEAKGIAVNARNVEKCLPWLHADASRFMIRLEDMFFIPPLVIPSIRKKDDFLAAPGRDIIRTKRDKAIEARIDEHIPLENDIASLIYTSGTTGTPKGVLLTHRNLIWNADVSTDIFIKLKAGMRILSILPLSHVYEFTPGQLLPLMCGMEIHYLGKTPAASILMPALKEIRPHVMFSVPLLIEKVYRSAVVPVLGKEGPIKKFIHNPLTRRLVYRLIGSKLMTTFGGHLKFFGIGGAPLDPVVEEFLHKAGFPYAIGYGLTETSPLIAGCGPAQHVLNHIGRIVPHLDVRLDDKNPETGVGEIHVKGPGVMVGYYKNPELNAEAFTEDGYFRTGDLGVLNAKGKLGIRGRLKTMILGSGGENIYPESIESLINGQNFVQESLVLPEGKGLIALIKLDMESYAKQMQMSLEDTQESIYKYLERLRDTVNKELGAYSRISSVALQDEPFERTPTQKIKRYLYNALGRITKKPETAET